MHEIASKIESVTNSQGKYFPSFASVDSFRNRISAEGFKRGSEKDSGSEKSRPVSDSIRRISPTNPTQSQLAGALAKMPTVYRDVFQAIQSGQTVGDVAKARKLSVKAVENIMRRTMSFG
jgi:DNA-binding NarL/FixJ family response regulator